MADISDLLAIAFVRRTLLEFGYRLKPDAVSVQADVGLLEMWVHQARPELDGLSPLAVFRTESGPNRLRELLRAFVEAGNGLSG